MNYVYSGKCFNRSSPIIYKYDLYAFGLILNEVLHSFLDALEKNLLFDPRKYRAKRGKDYHQVENKIWRN